MLPVRRALFCCNCALLAHKKGADEKQLLQLLGVVVLLKLEKFGR